MIKPITATQNPKSQYSIAPKIVPTGKNINRKNKPTYNNIVPINYKFAPIDHQRIYQLGNQY